MLPLDEEDSSTSNATLGLNHYTATHYGGKVYKAHEGNFVDASMYRALKGVDPPEAGKVWSRYSARNTTINTYKNFTGRV